MPECVLLCEGDPITRQRWLAQATEIFFATAYTSNFPSEDEKYSFWMRWFGSYAGTYPDAFVLALDDKGNVIGYLAGCIDSYSESSKTITTAIDYFTPHFFAALQAYPSHFHINVKPGYQGKGTGHRLAGRFVQLCANAGSPGIHVLTGAQSRAIEFYELFGFTSFPEASVQAAVLVLRLDRQTPR